MVNGEYRQYNKLKGKERSQIERIRGFRRLDLPAVKYVAFLGEVFYNESVSSGYAFIQYQASLHFQCQQFLVFDKPFQFIAYHALAHTCRCTGEYEVADIQ